MLRCDLNRKLVFCMILLFVISVFIVPLRIEWINASGTVYIRADGSIDPTTAPISTTDNISYFFTADIYDSVIVNRDNIVVDGGGYTVNGTGRIFAYGIDMSGRENVTLKNVGITGFTSSINLETARHCTVTGSNLTDDNGISMRYGFNNNVIGNHIECQYVIVSLRDSNHNNISMNRMIGTESSTGISLSSSDGNLLDKNEIFNCGFEGVKVYLSTNNVISENLIDDSTSLGVELESSSYNLITGNTIMNSGYAGILVDHGQHNSIISNNITENQRGIYAWSCHDILIDGNLIEANVDFGIRLWARAHSLHVENNTIIGNNIANNQAGIEFLTDNEPEKLRNNTITLNNITGNQVGISLSHCSGNEIYHNNFIDNLNHVMTDDFYNSWDDDYPSGGNYWDDYDGNDVDHDGIGDTSHNITEHNVDRYPLMTAIPEFQSLVLLSFFMILAVLAAVACKRKHALTA